MFDGWDVLFDVFFIVIGFVIEVVFWVWFEIKVGDEVLSSGGEGYDVKFLI